MSDFEFPAMYIGCPVQISSDPSESDKTLGWAFDIGNGAISVISIAGKQHFDCWHGDDPRCVTESNVFQNFDDRGVFRLTEGEIQVRHLCDRMATLESRLTEVILEFRRLSAEPPDDEPAKMPMPPKRRRGRPRRSTPVGV